MLGDSRKFTLICFSDNRCTPRELRRDVATRKMNTEARVQEAKGVKDIQMFIKIL